MGSSNGAIRTAAMRLGISVDDYRAKQKAGLKWCHGCKDWHPCSKFSIDRSRGDGLSARCRTSRSRQTKPGPTISERRTAKARGEAWCRRCMTWLVADRVRDGLCREHRNEAHREWYRANSRRVCGRTAARRRGVAAVGPNTREMLVETTSGLCSYGCGRTATQLDHVIPVAAGGQTVRGNMVPACATCNSRKKHNDPIPWLARMTGEAWDLILPTLLDDGPVMDLMNELTDEEFFARLNPGG